MDQRSGSLRRQVRVHLWRLSFHERLPAAMAANGRGLEGVKEFISKSSLVLLDVALPDDDDDEAEDDGTARFTLGLRPGAS